MLQPFQASDKVNKIGLSGDQITFLCVIYRLAVRKGDTCNTVLLLACVWDITKAWVAGKVSRALN